jgi:HSP20 family protein
MRLLTPYWTTRSLASDLFDEMDRVFDDKEIQFVKTYDERNFSPACEITEADDHFVMSVDLPGMKKDEIKIELNGEQLTITGERKRRVKHEKDSKIQPYERSYGYFKRSFALPSIIDADKVEAQYENGVLDLYIPKSTAARKRQIEIKTEKAGIFEKLIGSSRSENEEKEVNSIKVS